MTEPSNIQEARGAHFELPPHSNSFWGALKETVLDMLFGASQREAWLIERARRAYAEALMQRHLEAVRNLAAEGHGPR